MCHRSHEAVRRLRTRDIGAVRLYAEHRQRTPARGGNSFTVPRGDRSGEARNHTSRGALCNQARPARFTVSEAVRWAPPANPGRRPGSRGGRVGVGLRPAGWGRGVSFAIGPGCTGCDMCVRACPRGAIHVFNGRYSVVGLDCNDCGMCAIVCPEHVIYCDPTWARCWGRGCPLSANRYDSWACSEGRRRCDGCGNSLWRPPGSDRWICVRCDREARVMCPKVRKAERATDAEPAA